MSASITPIIPQPTPDQDRIINTVFAVLSMAINTLALIPHVNPQVLSTAQNAVLDIERIYANFKKHPNDDIFAQIDLIWDQALQDIQAVLVPPTTP